MAAGDFTASVANRVNTKLMDMFKDPNVTNAEFKQPFDTARAFLENQTANVAPVLEGNQCVGAKVMYFKGSNDLTVSKSTNCTTPTGTELETSSKNYDTDVLVAAAGRVKDNDCSNEYDFIEKSAMLMKKMLNDIRVKLNRTTILSALSAVAQTNLDTDIPTSWDDTTNAPRIDVPEDQFTWDNLGEFEAVANNNNIYDYFMVSGRNFYLDAFNSQYLKLNDDGKSGSAAYGDFNIYFDLKHLYSVLSRRSTFLVDKNSYVFWNQFQNGAVAVQVDSDRWVYTMADPVLKYMKNGSLVPVVYEVEYKKTCTSRNSLNQLIIAHDWYIRLIGGFEFAPAGVNSETGLLEFSAVSAV